MIKKRRFPKIYFGWWTVLTAGLLNMWTAGFQMWGFSALFKPMATELGFSRAATSVAASISRLESGVEGPITGWVTDRFGPRGVILCGIFLASLGMILMNFIDSLWTFYLVWGVIVGTAANLIFTTPSDTAIANWFIKKRGTAMGTKWLMSGLAGVLTLPIVARLIIGQGWRTTLLVGGIVLGSIGSPLAWFFMRPHRPEHYGLLPDGATVDEEVAGVDQTGDSGAVYAVAAQEINFTLRQALKTPTFWLLVLSQSIHGLGGSAIRLHGIPFLTDMGIDPLKAAGMVALLVAASVPMRFAGGFLGDRISKEQLRFVVGGAYLLQALGLAIFLRNQTIPMIYVWFVLFGIGDGLGITPNFLIRARYFGRKAYGSISGLSRGIMALPGLVGPIWLGWAYDTTGSYITAFVWVAALATVAAILMFFVPTPKPPTEGTDVHEIM